MGKLHNRNHELHDDQCDCELVMDDYFASPVTLEVHINEAIDEYMRLSVGCTDEMIAEATAAIWRRFSQKEPTHD